MNSDTTEKAIKSGAACLIVAVIYIGLSFLVARGIEWAWNIFVPEVFHGPAITYWEAYAFLVLASLATGFLRSSAKS